MAVGVRSSLRPFCCDRTWDALFLAENSDTFPHMPGWEGLYVAAILERDPKKLRERIDAAYAAMEARRRELQSVVEEHRRLIEAQKALSEFRQA